MNGRERTRLRKAREDGYLDACCLDNRELVQAYGTWCWRLKLPMVWLERRTRYSRYARVHLEMFTSANRLTSLGQDGIKAICAPGNTASSTTVSGHDACWDHVAMANARDVARSVFRAAIRAENYERNAEKVVLTGGRNSGKVLQMASA